MQQPDLRVGVDAPVVARPDARDHCVHVGGVVGEGHAVVPGELAVAVGIFAAEGPGSRAGTEGKPEVFAYNDTSNYQHMKRV